MNHLSADLSERGEDKSAQVHEGVRDLQVRFVYDVRAVQQQIQINDPGPPLLRPDSPHAGLNREKTLQKLTGRDLHTQAQHAIHKPVLVFNPYGARQIPAGAPDELTSTELLQLFDRFD